MRSAKLKFAALSAAFATFRFPDQKPQPASEGCFRSNRAKIPLEAIGYSNPVKAEGV
jgi:hypothetical protein